MTVAPPAPTSELSSLYELFLGFNFVAAEVFLGLSEDYVAAQFLAVLA